MTREAQLSLLPGVMCGWSPLIKQDLWQISFLFSYRLRLHTHQLQPWQIGFLIVVLWWNESRQAKEKKAGNILAAVVRAEWITAASKMNLCISLISRAVLYTLYQVLYYLDFAFLLRLIWAVLLQFTMQDVWSDFTLLWSASAVFHCQKESRCSYAVVKKNVCFDYLASNKLN